MRGLKDLPEPAELYRAFNRHYPLDWGDRVPTKAELAAEFGELATRRALETLVAIGWRDEAATEDLCQLVPPNAELYQPEKRIKSPQSLARKIRLYTGKRGQVPVIEDVQRYTVLTAVHDQLVETTRKSAQALHDQGWRLSGARNSYVDGSRYKGIHLNWADSRGQRVEVQLQSTAAIAVKEATTQPYAIARNDKLPRAAREEARLECVRLADGLCDPRGIGQLTELCGIPVRRQGYGLGHEERRSTDRTSTGEDGRPPADERRERRGLGL